MQPLLFFRYFPFIIILKHKDVRNFDILYTYRIKIDPGSIKTGIAIVRNSDNSVMMYIQIKHRAANIVEDLETRFNARHNRRQRETRYRKPKWPTKYQKKGSQLPMSLS